MELSGRLRKILDRVRYEGWGENDEVLPIDAALQSIMKIVEGEQHFQTTRANVYAVELTEKEQEIARLKMALEKIANDDGSDTIDRAIRFQDIAQKALEGGK
jgi:hypothetical protein